LLQRGRNKQDSFKRRDCENDYNLSPSRYVSQNSHEEVLPLEDAVVQLREAEKERAEVDRKLQEILKKLGL